MIRPKIRTEHVIPRVTHGRLVTTNAVTNEQSGAGVNREYSKPLLLKCLFPDLREARNAERDPPSSLSTTRVLNNNSKSRNIH